MREVQLSGQKKDNVNTGSKTVGTSPVALSENGRALGWGVQVVASGDNANSVWVGRRANLTAGSSEANDGIELSPGSGAFIPAPTEEAVIAVSDAADQSVSFLSY